MDELIKAQRRYERARLALEKAVQARRNAILAAIEAGESKASVARRLGVTRARIDQLVPTTRKRTRTVDAAGPMTAHGGSHEQHPQHYPHQTQRRAARGETRD
jgi:hypothetical protein